jgi:hypothetical protein
MTHVIFTSTSPECARIAVPAAITVVSGTDIRGFTRLHVAGREYTVTEPFDVVVARLDQRAAMSRDIGRMNATITGLEDDAVRMETERDALRAALDLANEKLAVANTGGLPLLYDIRRALGWNEKTSLSILADGVRRVRRALQTWDTPTGMDLEALAMAVKARVVELERVGSDNNARINELLEALDDAPKEPGA